MARRYWELSYEEQEALEPKNRLKEKLSKVFGEEAEEIVSCIAEMMADVRSDLRDEINRSGEYAPDY